MPNGELGFVVYNPAHSILAQQIVLCDEEIAGMTASIIVSLVGLELGLAEGIVRVNCQRGLRHRCLHLEECAQV